MDNPADREKLRRTVLDLVAGRKMPSKKGVAEILSFSLQRTIWIADAVMIFS